MQSTASGKLFIIGTKFFPSSLPVASTLKGPATYFIRIRIRIGPLFFFRRNLFSCPQDMREAAYKGLVRPILEYGSSVWDPHYEGLIDDLEKVQKRAARLITRNYTYEKSSMTDILKKLKWESLQKRRKDNIIYIALQRSKRESKNTHG